jgi:hypothetical protein
LTEFNITSISGTVTPTFGVVSPITGPSTFDGADNELFELGTSGVYYLDNKGVSFTLKNGNTVNLSTGGFTYYADSNLPFTTESIAFDIHKTSPVPEPSSIALLGTGLLSAAGVVRRRLKA